MMYLPEILFRRWSAVLIALLALMVLSSPLRADENEEQPDPGTVTKILQSNANGAQCVAVKWFTWDNSRTTQEYITELQLLSAV